MSTTIHASTSMSTDKVNTVEPVLGARPPIAPAAFRRRRRAAQLLMGAVIAIGATLGVVAPRADAMIIGNPVYSSPNNFTAEVHCSRGLLQITARTSVQSGYVNGQYVIWQYHLRNPRGHSEYSTWSGVNSVAHNNYAQQSLGTAPRRTVTDTSWDVSVRAAYWNGYSWVTSPWHVAGKRQAGYSDWQRFCWT